jgi:tetratricopeptide (TPR) repeat protein
VDRGLARAEWLVQRGRKLLDTWEDEAEIDRAVELFRQATTLAPDHAEAWHGLADALDEVEEFDEALQAYHRALALGADSPTLWRHLAEVASIAGELPEAVSAAERARAQAPDDVDTLEVYARVLTRVALYDPPAEQGPAEQRALLERALAALEHMVALQPMEVLTSEVEWALRGQGGLLIALGRLEEALATFTYLGQAAPRGRNRYLVAGAARDAARGPALALDRLGRPEEALAALEEGQAHNTSPEPVWSLFQSGLVAAPWSSR